jgi:Tol biopolymer transport system component
MSRLIATACFLLPCLWAWASGPASAEELPGRLLVTDHPWIKLYEPSTGKLRRVARSGGWAAFFPSGKGFAYIGEGNFPRRPTGRYSIFWKSFAQRNASHRGRRVFDWNRFFVRAVDVSPGGRLVFSADPDIGSGWNNGRGMEIYSSELDGSGLRRLTHNQVLDNDPVVSPNGKYIAFARRVARRGQIFSMRIDGTNEVRLTHDRRRNRQPSWAPDGRRIAFTSDYRSAPREIYVVSANGGRGRRLTHTAPPTGRCIVTSPRCNPVSGGIAYSPNGSSIAFIGRNGNLWAVDADGTSLRQILAARGLPTFGGGLDWGW